MKGTISAIGAAVLMPGGGGAALAASPQQQGTDAGGSYTKAEVIGGVTFHREPAPRLSTFVRSGSHWRMTSHANFNRPS